MLCDHASKAVPKALGMLGLSEAEIARHIGWDIGGLDAALALARLLDAPLVASGYSRLVIDCNRWPGGEGSTPEVSDGTPVPANHGLDARSRSTARAEACFWPYHREVDRQLDRMTADGRTVALLVVHSFTPRMDGFDRPWHVGVLWSDDAAPAGSAARRAAARPGTGGRRQRAVLGARLVRIHAERPCPATRRCRTARWKSART